MIESVEISNLCVARQENVLIPYKNVLIKFAGRQQEMQVNGFWAEDRIKEEIEKIFKKPSTT